MTPIFPPDSDPHPGSRTSRETPLRRVWRVAAPATVLCLLNALKPLTLDDPAYHAYAAQIAAKPLDPYGFTIHWYQHPTPAGDVLAPPVFCYWWALGLRLLGDSPILWKLGLWPWCLTFAGALNALLRRFARPIALPLLWMTVLSPAVLPALNLMLDVPSLALSLLAVAVFLTALERDVWAGAAAAGVLAGLAMQTKYTALLTPVIFLLAVLYGPPGRRRWLLGAVAILAAGGLFWAWEAFVALRYGQSHFLHHLEQTRTPLGKKLNLFWPLFSLLGALAVPLFLLGLVAWRFRARSILFAALLSCVSLVALAVVPEQKSAPISNRSILFGCAGLFTAGMLIASAGRLFRRPDGGMDRFLVLWWLAEVAGYFVLSPWPAARRVMGVIVVGTLLTGRLAADSAIEPGRRRLVLAVAGFSVALGLLVEAIDIDNASADPTAVALVARVLDERGAGNDVWFVGHWGFQFYVERIGWRPVDPDQSTLRAGDWLVVPNRDYGQQRIDIPTGAAPVFIVTIPSRWPLRTVPWYHGTATPLCCQDGPMLTVTVYRVLSDCVPRTPATGGMLGPGLELRE